MRLDHTAEPAEPGAVQEPMHLCPWARTAPVCLSLRARTQGTRLSHVPGHLLSLRMRTSSREWICRLVDLWLCPPPAGSSHLQPPAPARGSWASLFMASNPLSCKCCPEALNFPFSLEHLVKSLVLHHLYGYWFVRIVAHHCGCEPASLL